MKDDFEKRGVKRKRFEPPKPKDLGARIVGKLHHDIKEVRKAAKKAKSFETQKLVKKLKGLRLKSDPNVEDCEQQLEELKRINHEAVANTALRSKLTKDKVLSDHESMQTALSQELADNLLQPASGGTAAKVQSRLLSSKILASEVASVVEDLRSVIHPFTTDSQDGDVSAELDESMPERPKKLKKLSMQDIPEDEDVEMDLGGNDEDEEEDEEDEEDIVDAGEDDENNADEWESGTIGDDEKEPDNGWESGSIAGESDGFMDEDLPSDSEEVPQRTSVKAVPAAGQSTFLPSLSTGFIRGSDSDWSDTADQAAELGQKKNRRGQRARRAIWEKKYGKNANHKKKEAASAETERGRKRWPNGNKASDRFSNKGPSRKFQGGEPPAQSKPQASGRDERGPATGDRDARPLHPSWEAKKKLSAAIVPPTGRKIKFS
ncbi:hypothetical protein GYMLUDRAFT_33928 [Collybiopsis luxurians FD-317 M1]|nr:hypothetical protein GYMLUDRAFT_33928 [Collybiopsis luxurians FD-317 M1]